MELGMREPYVEGVAMHDDPESCVGVPRGRSEALTGGVQAGLLSREIRRFGVPTSCLWAEGHIASSAIAGCQRTPRGRRTCACTCVLKERKAM
jgi:hypothetical protein